MVESKVRQWSTSSAIALPRRHMRNASDSHDFNDKRTSHGGRASRPHVGIHALSSHNPRRVSNFSTTEHTRGARRRLRPTRRGIKKKLSPSESRASVVRLVCIHKQPTPFRHPLHVSRWSQKATQGDSRHHVRATWCLIAGVC